MSDYNVAFTSEQRARLEAIFPKGVCDWSKRGVQQVKAVPWASFGPSPEPGVRCPDPGVPAGVTATIAGDDDN